MHATGGLKSGKTSCSDMILPSAMQETIRLIPEFLLQTYNGLLTVQKLPKIWQTAKVFLISKTIVQIGKHHSLYMTDVSGKICERMLKAMLADKNFKTAKRWCTMVTVVVKSAFNTAPWTNIINRLHNLGSRRYLIITIENSLTDRYIPMEKTSFKMSCGVPQGCVIGPILCNRVWRGTPFRNAGSLQNTSICWWP